METEEASKPGKAVLWGLGLIALLSGAALAGVFIFRLQPNLGGGNNTVAGGTVSMPLGVGSNTQLNFTPGTITVILGVNDTVTFVNDDSVIHTVTATDHSFDSGDIAAGKSFTYKFTTAGTFTYYCIYHSSWMKGTVVVKEGSGGGTFTVKIPAGTGSDTSLNYSPNTMNLVVGVNNTVVFVNQDSVVHTVTATDGSFDSGDIPPGGTWSHTFAAGTYHFKCIYHSYMTGTITVLAP